MKATFSLILGTVAIALGATLLLMLGSEHSFAQGMSVNTYYNVANVDGRVLVYGIDNPSVLWPFRTGIPLPGQPLYVTELEGLGGQLAPVANRDLGGSSSYGSGYDHIYYFYRPRGAFDALDG